MWQVKAARVLLLLSLLIGLPCLAQAVGRVGQLRVEVCSEESLTSNPNELTGFCVLITNDSEIVHRVQIGYDCPKGWEVVPIDSSEVDLEPGATHLHLVAVRVAQGCLADRYRLGIVLREDGKLVARSDQFLTVCRVEGIVARSGPCPAIVSAGSSYGFDIFWENSGNSFIPLRVVATSSPECLVEIVQHQSAPAEGGISAQVMPADRCDSFVQLVNIKIFHDVTNEILWEYSTSVEVIPEVPTAIRPALSVPAWFGTYVGHEHGRTIVGVELLGGGCIDEERERWADVEVRLPSTNRSGVYNKMVVLRAAVGEPDWTAEVGDAVYRLSQLTECWRYGTGAHAMKIWDRFEAGAMYVAHRADDSQGGEEHGGYALWRPVSDFFVCCNFLHKGPANPYPSADILSIQFCHCPSPWFRAEAEFAKDYGPFNGNHAKHAYHIRLCGEAPENGGSYLLERLRAGSGYLGYYNNTELTAVNLEGPLSCRLRACFNATLYSQNLGPPCDYLSVLPENRYFLGQLSYALYQNLQLVAAARVMAMKDRMNPSQFNQRQEWTDARIFYSAPGLILTGSASLGRQHDILTHSVSGILQAYSLYGCWNRSPDFEWNLLAETGNIQYYDVNRWRSALGGGFRWCVDPSTWVQFYANMAVNMPELSLFKHVSATVGHTRPNGHRIYVNTQYYSCKKAAEPEEFLAYVSYDIPFEVIIPQEVKTGIVCGVVVDIETETPLEHAVVSLSGQRTLTNDQGFFCFPAVCPGIYEVSASLLPENYTTVIAKGSVVTVRQGSSSRVEILTVRTGLVQGRVTLYDIGDSLEDAENFILSKKSSSVDLLEYLHDVGGFPNVRITMTHKDSGIHITYRTTPFGYFRFNKLRPGVWQVDIESDDIPSTHELAVQQREIVLHPGQEVQLDIKVVPVKGRLLSFITEASE